ncbi:hypothetical protein LWI28_007143 [Acer negundo]|uniref:Uncharacterized protein n=1 Tax=Acer negundo TaxID=4023 RepID=A0AAD5NMX1_ACENE|nr:hypothetical protein LWI28_007143 [Acer negundo]
MEEGLLVKKEELEEKSVKFGLYVEEVKRVGCIAAPMVAVNFLQVISTMMVGHLGELFLSSTAIATSFSAVTGFSLLFGMSTAMETLCGQGFGANQYQKIGIQFQTALFSLLLVCLPVTLLWVNMGKLLLFLGQDPSIASGIGYATLQPLFELNNVVGAIAIGIARGVYVNLLAYYVFRIPVAAILTRTLDWYTSWCFCADSSTLYHNKLSKLEKTDKARQRIFEDDGKT